jgi:hypothetical protein
MHVMKRFTLTFAAMTGFGIAPLIGQSPSLQTVPLSADIDVVSVRTLPDGNTLRQERKMKFYRRADGSTRVEEPNRVVIVDNSSHILSAALMLPPHPCGAQSSNGCPVQIRHTSWKAASSGFSPYKVKGVALYLQYMNVTDEEIKEVVFDAASSYRESHAPGGNFSATYCGPTSLCGR